MKSSFNLKKESLIFVLHAILLLAIEIYIGIYIHDSFVRPYLGDTLVVILLYCIVRAVVPKGFYWLSIAIFAFAVLVELSQLLPLCDVLHIQNKLLRILMGSHFAYADILAYLAGNILTGVVDFILWRKYRKE